MVLSIEDLAGLEETLEILSDRPLMRRLDKADTENKAGKAEVLTKEQALGLVRKR